MNHDPRKAIRQAMMIARREVTAPNKASIGGQRHMLAYITPYEAELLMRRGGSGRLTEYGVPAFDDGDGAGGGGDAANSEASTQDAAGGNAGEGAGPTGAGAGATGETGPDDTDASVSGNPAAVSAPTAPTATAPFGTQGFGQAPSALGMGAIGTIGGMAMGVPGLGALGTAIGTGMDVEGLNSQLGMMGLQQNVDYETALAHNMSLGMLGKSATDQFGQTLGFDALAEAPMAAFSPPQGLPDAPADTSGGPSVVPIIRQPQQNPMEDAEMARQQALMASSNPMQQPLMLASGGAATARMDPRSLPGIHLKTDHRFADGGGVQPEEEEGFDAYHGSPHEFERFDSSKIGTGEGAQAFGYGHYLAENEGVARSYRDKLTNLGDDIKLGNYEYNPATLRSYINDPKELDKDIRLVKAQLEKAKKLFQNSPDGEAHINSAQQYVDHYENLKRIPMDQWPEIPQGHMYHVRVKAKPEHFLDWDAPLSEQHPQVVQALNQAFPSAMDYWRSVEGKAGDNGGHFHAVAAEDLSGSTKKGHEQIAAKLQAAGIPGIKYFDRDSRDEGKGTRNYVIFDPDMIKVKRRYADGGEIMPQRDLRADPAVQRALDVTRGYQDPPTKHIEDWQWKPLPEVQQRLGGMREIPSHVQAFGNYMDEIAKRAGNEGLSARDLIKAYTITRASIQRRANDVDRVRAAGLDLPKSFTGKIRPEGAFGEWLHTRPGQDYLDSAERGEANEDAIANAVKIMTPFGKHEKDIPDALRWAAANLPGKEQVISTLVTNAMRGASEPAEWRSMAKDVRGIGPSKAGFLASLMGRGDQPTLDARQIIEHTGRPTSEAQAFLRRKGGEGATEAVERLSARQQAMNLELPEELKPYYQHLAHHAVWDKAADEVTTHEDVMNAMRGAASGGEIDAGSILSHPVVHAMRMAGLPKLEVQRRADGGTIGDDPTVQRALDITRQAQPTAPQLARQLNEQGMYSHAAEVAAGLPQVKGSPQQMLAMLSSRGVKPDEIKHSGVEDAFGNQKVVTKDQLAQHFNENMPQIEKVVLGGKQPFDEQRLAQLEKEYSTLDEHPIDAPSFGEDKYNEMIRLMNIRDQSSTQSLYDSAERAMQQAQRAQSRGDRNTAERYFREHELLNTRAEKLDLEGQGLSKPTKYKSFTLPGGENYREVLFKAKERNADQLEAAQNKRYESRLLYDDAMENYKKISESNPGHPNAVAAYQKVNETRSALKNAEKELSDLQSEAANRTYESSHWDEPNVLAHVRLLDRKAPNGEKVLHVEEIQSDWAQEGRREGFKDVDALKKFQKKSLELMAQFQEAHKAHKELVNRLAPLVHERFRPGEESPREYEDRIDALEEERQKSLAEHPEWKASAKKLQDIRNAHKALGEQMPSDTGVPAGPYVTNTQAWTDLALKAALKEAVEGNYDRIAWTGGQDQAERYDLSKHIDSVHYNPGTQTLYAMNKNGREVLNEDAEPHEIQKHIGKELADKLLADVPDLHSVINEHDIEKDPETGKWGIFLYGDPIHDYGGDPLEFDSKSDAKDHLREMAQESLNNHTSTLRNVDLVVGGEGMKSYYDKIVPTRIMEVTKKLGVPTKVEPHKIDTEEGEKTLHSIKVTPELKAAVMRGMPIYKAGGAVSYNNGGMAFDSPIIQEALRIAAKKRPMVALADLFQRQLRGRPPS